MNFAGDAVKIAALDIAPLATEITALDEGAWGEDRQRQELFAAHARTETIKLIFDPDYRHSEPTIHPAFLRFEPVLAPTLEAIRCYYARTHRQRRTIDKHGPGYFVRAILTRLAPEASIEPHIDGGDSLKRCHRIHLPVLSNPECLFVVGDSALYMAPGELWEINNRRTHAVDNRGSQRRVHLILDYVQPGETVFDLDGPLTA